MSDILPGKPRDEIIQREFFSVFIATWKINKNYGGAWNCDRVRRTRYKDEWWKLLVILSDEKRPETRGAREKNGILC